MLFAGAVVTAYFAHGAFRVQSDQLRLQSEQVQDQQKVNKQLAEVLPLQKEDFEQARDERERERKEQRRAQANKVTAWATLEEPGPHWQAVLRNASDLPAYNVLVKFYWYDAAWFEKDPLGGKYWTPFTVGQKGQRLVTLFPSHDEVFPGPPSDPPKGEYVVALVGIEFTDASGHRWERDPLGYLKDAE